jgi:hypothetical protein
LEVLSRAATMVQENQNALAGTCRRQVVSRLDPSLSMARFVDCSHSVDIKIGAVTKACVVY